MELMEGKRRLQKRSPLRLDPSHRDPSLPFSSIAITLLIRSSQVTNPNQTTTSLPITIPNVKMCGSDCTCGSSCSCSGCSVHSKYVGLGVPLHDPLSFFCADLLESFLGEWCGNDEERRMMGVVMVEPP